MTRFHRQARRNRDDEGRASSTPGHSVDPVAEEKVIGCASLSSSVQWLSVALLLHTTITHEVTKVLHRKSHVAQALNPARFWALLGPQFLLVRRLGAEKVPDYATRASSMIATRHVGQIGVGWLLTLRMPLPSIMPPCLEFPLLRAPRPHSVVML